MKKKKIKNKKCERKNKKIKNEKEIFFAYMTFTQPSMNQDFDNKKSISISPECNVKISGKKNRYICIIYELN